MTLLKQTILGCCSNQRTLGHSVRTGCLADGQGYTLVGIWLADRYNLH